MRYPPTKNANLSSLITRFSILSFCQLLTVFTDKFQPDQIKVYPCEVVPWTKIEKWHKDGKYKPYGEDRDKMDIVLKYAMTCMMVFRYMKKY